ncbi:MAG: hypothetical protein B6I31_04900 [Desulfobacteraceae bacterium 4572_19]|nr:MAG: hypothetical protein B6I31_04900 [Desulfobacteraceae bacterium 4572_19]
MKATYTVMLENGLLQIINDIKAKEQNALTKKTEDGNRQADFFKAVQISLQGIVSYADNLAKEAQYLADITNDHKIKKEFLEIANVCKQVPAYPARTFREAVNAFWICQIGIHGENINMAMSPGRLDQVLYPWYRHDVEEGSINIKDAMEIIACLWFKLSDNVIMVPEASESLFGGAGTVPAVTLGGVDAKGEDAVNDLTYIMLRVTELLKIRDPNVNARYHFEKNTKQYINRVSEVLVNTQAVPAFFNDKANIKALEGQGETTEHARDYAIVGCVELSSSGRDYPASSSIMLNLAAPMEMALFEGKRPITGDQQIGPATLAIDKINSFKDFQNAFITQLDWLINQAIELNEYFGATHQDIMPSPLLSAFFHGPLQKGKDIINGGAIYNSSGATHIGFADVVDSLSAIEYIVFIKQRFTLKEVVQAVKRNFNTKEDLIIYQYLKNHTPRYGTEHPISQKNADYLIDHLYKKYQSNINYRGGPYRPAYWSMTNHAGLGKISYALPHGRKKGEVFASGITPVSEVVPELTACLNSVAKLDAEKIPGCLALNIKYTPEPDKEKMIKKFVQTIQAYFKSGGQQVQFNIMDYKMLEDAKKNPDKYPQLLVRVSGYSAYFKDLNDKMKDELITRTQYNLISGKAEQII